MFDSDREGEEDEEEERKREEKEEVYGNGKEEKRDRGSREEEFISSYIKAHNITAMFKWMEWRTNALEDAIAKAGLQMHGVENMKTMIRARVGAARPSVPYIA